MPACSRLFASAISLSFLLLPLLTRAQRTVATDCPPIEGASLCISLDARSSLDSVAAPVIFRWQMGDGQVREGVLFDYCYAQPGRYVLRLDVIDSLTREVRANEYERTIDLAEPPPILRFLGPDSIPTGKQAAFELDVNSVPACLSAKFRLTWTFDDGATAEGLRVNHVFHHPGPHRVRMAITGKPLNADCPLRPCNTQTVVVTAP